MNRQSLTPATGGTTLGYSANAAGGEEGVMAMSIFARLGTIKGDSQDAKHKDEIDVLS